MFAEGRKQDFEFSIATATLRGQRRDWNDDDTPLFSASINERESGATSFEWIK